MPRHIPRTVSTDLGAFTYHECTNGHVRDLVDVISDGAGDWRLAASEEELETSTRGFFYRGSLFSYDDFERGADGLAALGWDGWLTTSAFDAIVLKYFDEFGHELDGVIVGHVFW